MSGIIRVHKTKKYSVISNTASDDARLSFGARGVMTYLLTKPDNWEVRSSDLIEVSPHGRDAIRAMLRELEKFGYLHRKRIRLENGRYGWETEVFEEPQESSPKTGFPAQVKASTTKYLSNKDAPNSAKDNPQSENAPHRPTSKQLFESGQLDFADALELRRVEEHYENREDRVTARRRRQKKP
jgi:hypothetical protein